MSDEVLDEVRRLSEAADRLSTKVDGLSAALRKSRVITAILAAVVVACVGLIGIGIWNVQRTTHQSSCVRSWANASAGRTNALVPANTAKSDALDEMLRSLALPESKRKEKFQAAFVLYLKASDNYKELQAQNPPPTAPQYTC